MRAGDQRRGDPDLAADAAAGSSAAFEELVRRHQGVVRGMMRRLSGDASLADDLAQTTFMTAYRRIETYSGGQFRAWLCAIAYRTFLQARRSAKPEISSAEIIEFAARDQHTPTPGLKMDLDRALASLPNDQRVAIILCVNAGMSHSEVARLTGWPLGSVKSHVARGKQELRRLLAAYRVA